MKDPRYPKNWDAIALTKKLSVSWRCEDCGLKCLDPALKSVRENGGKCLFITKIMIRLTILLKT
jgi:hypothetical protein